MKWHFKKYNSEQWEKQAMKIKVVAIVVTAVAIVGAWWATIITTQT